MPGMSGMSGVLTCAAAVAGAQTVASTMPYQRNFTILSPPELLFGGPNLQVRPKRADLKVRPSIRRLRVRVGAEETIRF
jgi:hypothetical protein